METVKGKKSRRRLRRLRCQSARSELIRAAEGYFAELGATIEPDNIGKMVAAHLERLRLPNTDANPQRPESKASPAQVPRSTVVADLKSGDQAAGLREFSYPNGPLNVVVRPQGISGSGSPDSSGEPKDQRPMIVLHRPEIPPNTGTIARLCAAFQLPLVLIGPLGFDISEKAFRRAGLDYWQWVDLSFYDSWTSFVATLADSGRRLVFVETFGSKPVGEFVFEPLDVLVFGSETTGLPRSIVEANWGNQSAIVRIPMPAVSVRSINLANAVAIVASHAIHRSGGAAQEVQSTNAPAAKK